MKAWSKLKMGVFQIQNLKLGVFAAMYTAVKGFTK